METFQAPSNEHNVHFPAYASLLDEDARFIVLYGGRGGAKSWSVARKLLEKGIDEPLRVLCARQVQNSIKESVHQLLRDQISDLDLWSEYEVKDNEIVGKRVDTLFSFAGLQALKTDPTKVKSYEGYDICWIEEGVNVTKTNFEILEPTFRKDNSKIIITFNPLLETDFVYEYFVKNDPPPRSIVAKVSFRDNPWFPKVLEESRKHKELTDPDGYLHIWEGQCRLMLEGAIYASELRAAQTAGRITKVPYDPTRPVDTFWDLGHSDGCAIWFAQVVGFERRVIDYYENRMKGPDHYLSILQNRGYIYGTDFLPHDADYEQFAAQGRTVRKIMQSAGRKVRVIKRPSRKQMSIDACRLIFPTCYFDEKRCSEGLQRLRHYKYEVDPDTKAFSKHPEHDENSHGADAFGTLGLYLRDPVGNNPIEQLVEVDLSVNRSDSWMTI